VTRFGWGLFVAGWFLVGFCGASIVRQLWRKRTLDPCEKSRWFFVRFELRQARLRLVSAIKVALFGKPPAQPVSTLCGSPPEGHPSELCCCECGPDGFPEEHDPTCAWLAQMCETCDGSGYCVGCGGDGCKGKAVPKPPLGEVKVLDAEQPSGDKQLPLPIAGADPCLWIKSRERQDGGEGP
jgi:hypothetical protein